MCNNKILNILNGQVMQSYFERNNLDVNGIYIPFNEAMCQGEAKEKIFSQEFIKGRCDVHKVTENQYKDITLTPLKPLFEKEFEELVLWFDEDMFCQINLITILGYLDESNYRGKTTLKLVDNNFEVINTFDIKVDGYKELYITAIINKEMPKVPMNNVMSNGIKLYLQYVMKDNEITKYIRGKDNLEVKNLITKLIQKFSIEGKYGLGDTQYIELINRCRKDNK